MKRIRAIDSLLETELNRHGIRRYADIAQWRTEDVQRVSQALGFKGRIEQENWIEQAQILARGEDTFYSRRLARGEAPSARPVADEGERKPMTPAAPSAPIPERPRTTAEAAAAAAAAVAAANRAVAAATATPAVAPQVAPQAASAAPQPAPVAVPPRVVLPEVMRPMVEDRAAFARPAVLPAQAQPPQPPAQTQPAATPPAAARVAPPVQQAPVARPAVTQPTPVQAPLVPAASQAAPPSQQSPAVGPAVAPTQVVARPAQPAQAVPPQQPLSTPARPSAPSPQPQAQPQAARPVVSGASAAASAGAAAAAAAAAAGSAMVRPPIGSGRDNLQRIGGISAEVEKVLNVQGVTRYSQVAHWGPGETDRYDRLFGNQGRIQRENWVEQAQILAKGGDTAYSREYDRREAEALRNAEGTRPARLAEAVLPPDAASGTPSAAAPRANDLSSLRSVRSEGLRGPVAGGQARGGHPDDLKRIRGIGVLIEKKLNSMGITHYEQIANWSAADIDRVSHVLDFKGRIERENWVEQARILAAGGQTEFSRRADRDGETEA